MIYSSTTSWPVQAWTEYSNRPDCRLSH